MAKKQNRVMSLPSNEIDPARESEELSSPACLAHEMDSSYAGYFSSVELIEHLDAVIATEQALVATLRAVLPRVSNDRVHATLKGILDAHEDNIARCKELIRAAED